jgi:hypothetical protein
VSIVSIYHPYNNSKEIAKRSWEVLRDYVDPYQWAFDRPEKSPAAKEIAHARLNQGKKGCCKFYRPGRPFPYFLRVMQQWAFEKAVFQKRKLYYVSGCGPFALVYIDIDCHHAWQSDADAQQAQDILNQAGFPIYWVNSDRGINGYLKLFVGRTAPEAVNQLLKEFETGLQRVLAECDCLADVEIKGTVGYLSAGKWNWAKYGKLPIHSPEWDPLKFKAVQQYRIGVLRDFLPVLMRMTDPSKLVELNERKNTLRNRPISKSELARIEQELAAELGQRQAADTPDQPIRPVHSTKDLVDEPDSFIRQRKALLSLCRAAKRVVSVQEGLDYLEDQHLYTGEWDDNLARRTSRVRSILNYTAQTFDAQKVKHGKVDLGKFDKVAAKHAERIGVSANWVSVALSMIDFCLKYPNPDGSLPQERAKRLWKSLPVNECWDDLKWKAVRGGLRRLRVVSVDGIYFPGRAMHWKRGDFYPGRHTYKNVVVKTQVKRVYRGAAFSFNNTQHTLHNTLPGRHSYKSHSIPVLHCAQPPPQSKHAHSSVFGTRRQPEVVR